MTAISEKPISKMLTMAARCYVRLYEIVCGKHPYVYPWHFQWLAGKDLYPALRKHLPSLRGELLDIGCGDKPYRQWATGVTRYVGADLVAGPSVDVVLNDSAAWPLPDARFDAILSTQVIEHVRDLDLFLAEVRRVSKPGAMLLLSFPFIYPSHGEPHDYRRLSKFGVQELLQKAGAEKVLALETQGGIGSSLGLLLLTWLDTQFTRTTALAVIKVLLTPLWWLLCAVVNLLGASLDSMDTTGRYYLNVVVLVQRRLT